MGAPLKAWFALACASVFTCAGVSACVDVLGDYPPAQSDDGGPSDVGPPDAITSDTGADSTLADSGQADTTIVDSARPDSTAADSAPIDSGDADATGDASRDAAEESVEAASADGGHDVGPVDAPDDTLTPPDASAEAGADAAEEPDAIVDSGSVDSAVDSGVDSGFPVGSVAGLVLWLEANQGVVQSGGVVSAWTDQSPLGNGGVSTGPATPVRFTQPDFPNGQPGLTLGAPGDTIGTWSIVQVMDSASLQFSGDFLIETVVRMNSIGFGVVYEKQIPNVAPYQGVGMFLGNAASDGGPAPISWQVQFDENRNLLGDASFLGPDASDVGNWRIYGVQRAGAIVALRIDGQVNAQVDSTVGSGTWQPGPISVQAAGQNLGLGGSPGRYLFETPMDIAEVVAVSGSLSGSDLAGIEGYLASKYGIP